jgi:hypothetical protein
MNISFNALTEKYIAIKGNFKFCTPNFKLLPTSDSVHSKYLKPLSLIGPNRYHLTRRRNLQQLKINLPGFCFFVQMEVKFVAFQSLLWAQEAETFQLRTRSLKKKILIQLKMLNTHLPS